MFNDIGILLEDKNVNDNHTPFFQGITHKLLIAVILSYVMIVYLAHNLYTVKNEIIHLFAFELFVGLFRILKIFLTESFENKRSTMSKLLS